MACSTYDGTTWSGVRDLGTSLASVPLFISCPTSTTCQVISGNGDLTTATLPGA